MSSQAAHLAPPPSAQRFRRVELLYEKFHAAGLAALHALTVADAAGFSFAVKDGLWLTAALRESLSYSRNPTLSAYLKVVLDYVITQLVVGQGAQDRVAIARAIAAMDELHRAFVAAHQALP